MYRTHYDILIIGAGTSGCVIARKLAQKTGASVLMVEAGQQQSATLRLPIYRMDSVGLLHDWYWQPIITGSDRRFWLPRPKVVGGCSVIQAGVSLRGFPADYDAWGRVAPGWSFDDVLPFLREVESDADFQNMWHGSAGLWQIQRATLEQRQPIHDALVESVLALSFPYSEDLNHPEALGIGPIPLGMKDNHRLTVVNTYLEEAKTHNNFQLLPSTLVRRILHDGRRVTGVELQGYNQQAQTIYCDTAVVCAGAIGSPALLLRSGIGPADHLNAIGVPAVVDMPGVGSGLQDHPMISIQFDLGQGHGQLDVPWFQVMVRHRDQIVENLPDFAMEIYHNFRATVPGKAAVLSIALLQTNGSGQIRLLGCSPDSRPLVELDYHHPEDIQKLARLLNYAGRVIMSVPFERQLRPANLSLFTGETSLPFSMGDITGEKTQTIVKQAVTTGHHLYGTCCMGQGNDNSYVVDATCRLRGFENLFVADASIIPVNLRANTHLTCILIGEMFCTKWLNKAR